MYDETSFNDLKSRIEYETWLLEAVYEISDEPVLITPLKRMIYPANGDKVSTQNLITSATACITFGDWKRHFKAIATPLIFVTTFKLLDMFVEWVLEQNSHSVGCSFEKKKQAIQAQGLVFPLFIESKPWFKERLIGLYKELEPLRSTIIHNRHFKSTDGALSVSSTKRNTVGDENTITEQELRSLVILIVTLLRYIEGIWSIDLFGEKRLRHTLDQLRHLHKLPSLGQLSPDFLTVQVYAKRKDLITVDLKRIHEDLTDFYPHQDNMFNLKVVTVNSDRNEANTYLIPWDDLQNVGEKLVISMNEISRYQCDLPEDIDVSKLLEDLNQAEFKSPVAS